MFVLGHLGVGSHLLSRRYRARALWGWTALGCLLPDLLDKPLWLVAAAGLARDPIQLGLATGTRLFAHTLLLVGAVMAAGWLTRHLLLRAVGLGALTHLGLDLAGDLASWSPAWRGWLLWPCFGWRFPAWEAQPATFHLLSLSEQSFYLVGEALGFWLLLRAWLQHRRAGTRG